MTHPDSFDVIIVGAGPTGLALANALTLRRLRIAVLDRQAAGANTSRAAVVHAHTLEALESIGVSAELVRRGVRAQRFTIRDRDRILNTGIVDGLRLAEALDAAIHAGDAQALSRYEAERRPVAQGVVGLADTLTRLATARPAWRRPRNALLRILGSLPPFQRRLAWRLSGLVNRRPAPTNASAIGERSSSPPC